MELAPLCLDTSVLIAAICLEYGLPLLTLNDRHFTRVPGLTVLTPDAFLKARS